MMLSAELFTESWLYQDGKSQGKAEDLLAGKAEGLLAGKAEGKAEGLLAGKRAALHLAINKRFPQLIEVSVLDSIDRSEVLDTLLLAILEAQTDGEARAAVQDALRTR